MPRQAPAVKTAQARALCVAPSRDGAAVGAAILKSGGNAFDAAVAAGFMEAVVEPAMCGIGGYSASGVGFLAKSKKLVAIDADCRAPAAATPDMFPTIPARDPNSYKLADRRNAIGPLSVAVPGLLAGLLKTQATWGKLSRKDVMAPAIARARDGVSLPALQARQWQMMKAGRTEPAAAEKGEGRATVKMPELAESLEAIAQDGPEVFYSGRIGQAIVDHVRKLGGILTRQDLASYQPLIVEPVTVEVRGHVLATPPPASGGLTSLQIIALFDRLHRAGRETKPGAAPAYHAFLEILKVVWEERLTKLADFATMNPPPGFYLSDKHLDDLYTHVLEGLAHPSPGRVVAPDPLQGTVHLAAADAEGNLVAWTQTHGGSFGSKVMVPGTEIVLGHGMCRFEPRPGWANSVAPGKRPLHNMCPTIAVHNGEATLAAGAAGGRGIINNVALMIIGTLIQNLDAPEAIGAPRLQCQTVEPATLERKAGPELLAALRTSGHQVREAGVDSGKAHLIVRQNDAWLGVAEPRMSAASVAVVQAQN